MQKLKKEIASGESISAVPFSNDKVKKSTMILIIYK